MSNPSRNETPAHNATTVMMSLPTGELSTTLTASTCLPLPVTMRPSQMSFFVHSTWPSGSASPLSARWDANLRCVMPLVLCS